MSDWMQGFITGWVGMSVGVCAVTGHYMLGFAVLIIGCVVLFGRGGE
jgi:hypothetical protein